MASIGNRDPEQDSDEEEYSDDDDYDTSPRKREKQRMKLAMKQAITEIKTTFNGEKTNGEVTADLIQAFMTKHAGVFSYTGPEGTFFHKIIRLVHDEENQNSLDPVYIKPLFQQLVREYSHLLTATNDKGQNPLLSALHLKKHTWQLVDYMLNSCNKPDHIENAMNKVWRNGESLETCLTLAFKNDLNATVLLDLVRKASENLLQLADGSNRTPLHHAVNYRQCTDERVDVIKLLLERDNEIVQRHDSSKTFRPIETFLDQKYSVAKGKQPIVEYSIYGEHERTAGVYAEAQSKRETERKREMARKAEMERTDIKGMSSDLAFKEKEPPKVGSIPPKDLESQTGGDRDRALKRVGLDHEKPKQDAGQKSDENERRRQLRENQEREHRALKAKEEEKQRDMASERNASRPRQLKDQKELDEAAVDKSKIQAKFPGTIHAPNITLKRAGTQNFDPVEEKKQEKKGDKSKRPPRRRDPAVLKRNSAHILRILKLHYMRTRSIEMATSFLYGKNKEDIQIYFDYEGLPTEIQDYVFEERFGKDKSKGIQFDEVLMYVRFPHVAVECTSRKASKPRALGRQDMEFFFGWLYNKGVRRILKVEVDDSGKIPHSDEAIQRSLERFVIEHLNWKKIDLDPRVICQIGSKADDGNSNASNDRVSPTINDLRNLTLKWSGNNAVLRSWSELEGLPQLPNLETVNLILPAQSDLYDQSEWIQKNIDEFRDRLNVNAKRNRNIQTVLEVPHSNMAQMSEVLPQRKTSVSDFKPTQERIIVVSKSESKDGTKVPMSNSGLPRVAGRSNLVTEHEWLNCTERFAGCMNSFWEETVELPPKQLGTERDTTRLLSSNSQNLQVLQNLDKDVVVALIDDGVDCCDSAFSGRVIEGKTFDYQDSGVGQYYISARGHGTEMARMMLRVCPMANIYSIRLKTHTNPTTGLPSIDAISAASAIEAALEKNATIISMSWTLDTTQMRPEERAALDAALEKALTQKVPMFCSSSDQIASQTHYPSAYRSSDFFVIGAAHADGSKFGLAGSSNDFIFPGVNVNTSGGTSLPASLADKTSSTKESTGSSIATALAASLGALIVYCFKASALGLEKAKMKQGQDHVSGPSAVQPEDAERIIQHSVLKTAFNKIGKMDDGQFLKVWEKFQPASQYLEGEHKYEDKLFYIARLCGNLMEPWNT